MAPSSDFLRRLFHTDDGRIRRFPDEVSFHLVMGFRMKVLATIANDGSVSVASQARLEAQNQAVSVRALDVDHEDILTSPDAIGRVNELLAERFPLGLRMLGTFMFLLFVAVRWPSRFRGA